MISPGSASGVVHTPAKHEDLAHLRAGLRLVFDENQADALAQAWNDVWDNVEADTHVAQAIVRHASQARFLMRIPVLRDRFRSTPRTLGPEKNMSGQAAVLLALHRGIGLDIDLLGDLLELPPERIARDLFEARRALAPDIGNACARHTTAIGGYNDRAIPTDAHLALLSHAQHCEGCRHALELSQRIDNDLQAEVRRIEETLPPLDDGRQRAMRRTFQRVLLGTGAVILLALLLLVGLVVDQLFANPHQPVPAVAATPPRFSGWLVQQAPNGDILARNLATGELRTLTSHNSVGTGQMQVWPAVSPSGTRFAYFSSDSSQSSASLTVRDVNGNTLAPFEWENEGHITYPLGWINDNSMLFIQRAVQSSATSSTTDATQGTLFVVDVTNGTQRDLYHGAVDYASVSPDGTLVAIFPKYQQEWAGQTVEVRPLGPDGVGEPIITLEHRVVSVLTWAKDSSALYATTIADASVQPISAATSGPGYSTVNLLAVRRDGSMQTVLHVNDNMTHIQPLSTSPDGSELVYAVGTTVNDQTGTRQEWAYWRIRSDGTKATQLLATGTAGFGLQPFWSPDGKSVLLSATEPFYLGEASNAFQFPASASGRTTMLYAVPQNAHPQIMPAGMGSGAFALAWLPADALPTSDGAPATQRLTPGIPEPVPGLSSTFHAKSWSAADPGGNYVLLQDSGHNSPLIWDVRNQTARAMIEGVSELSWLPDTQLTVGTIAFTDISTRLIFYAPEADASFQSLDAQRFDPAGLGSDMTKHYAHPLVAPGGAAMTFFVVDDASRQVSLWVSGQQTSVQEVLRWALPNNTIPDVPLAAVWLNETTMLFTTPDRWDDGMPTRAALMRLTIKDGSPLVERLTTMDGQGNDFGVAVQELTVSRGGTQIAYRMRHYTQRAADRGRIDMIHVMSIDDVTRSLELVRGMPGNNLSWSPNGRWLLADIDQRVAIMSADGRNITYLTPSEQHVSNPFWLSDREVWFATESGTVRRVILSAE